MGLFGSSKRARDNEREWSMPSKRESISKVASSHLRVLCAAASIYPVATFEFILQASHVQCVRLMNNISKQFLASICTDSRLGEDGGVTLDELRHHAPVAFTPGAKDPRQIAVSPALYRAFTL